MKMKSEIIRIAGLALVFVVVAIVLVGCFALDSGDVKKQPNVSTSKKPIDEPPAEGEVQIVIEDFIFKPAEVTVAPGTKITWINKDEAPHTATSVDKKFNSGGLDTDDKFSFVFNDKGEYQYFCALHPHMKATITVK
jgi:plastocyanin